MDLTIHPEPGPRCRRWRRMLDEPPAGVFLGRSQQDWRETTRRELGLAGDRPIIATGHQTLLWHPGILSKYLVLESVCRAHDLATANLIVDQHVDHFAEFDVPVRRADGGLFTRRIELVRPRADVPMALHEPFTPPEPPPLPRGAEYALPSVEAGVANIIDSIAAHRDAPNAAAQMARALERMMGRWVRPITPVAATDLMRTSLARALIQAMTEDPHTCAWAYNRAVAAVPEAGIPPLLVRDDYVEVPLWRIRPDERRIRAYDNDLDPQSEVILLPRALLMTALVRLGMCDLFIHGTGGAAYDRAMEHWIRSWLGVEVAPVAVVSATVRLPLDAGEPIDIDHARRDLRRLWHDPAAVANGEIAPGDEKKALLDEIDAQPRNTVERRAAFSRMHEWLEQWRDAHAEAIGQARRRLEQAEQRQKSASIAARRDWPFPLHPLEQIDALAAAVEGRVDCRAAQSGASPAAVSS